MRWPRRGIIIRLAIYVPVISYLAWRAAGGCQGDQVEQAPSSDQPKSNRRVITMPDGTQQEILEMSREEAERYLGHPIPEPAKAEADAASTGRTLPKADPASTSPADTKADTKADAEADAASVNPADTKADAVPAAAEPSDAEVAAPEAAGPAD